MKKLFGILSLALLLLSCQNKSRQKYSPTLTETQSEESYLQPDTAVTEEVKELQEEVKVPSTPTASSSSHSHDVTEEVKELQEEVKVPSTPTASSSSHSHESSSYDNMRGFDPASEDDMEDNGMSRYMENNDEEGWD